MHILVVCCYGFASGGVCLQGQNLIWSCDFMVDGFIICYCLVYLSLCCSYVKRFALCRLYLSQLSLWVCKYHTAWITFVPEHIWISPKKVVLNKHHSLCQKLYGEWAKHGKLERFAFKTGYALCIRTASCDKVPLSPWALLHPSHFCFALWVPSWEVYQCEYSSLALPQLMADKMRFLWPAHAQSNYNVRLSLSLF